MQLYMIQSDSSEMDYHLIFELHVFEVEMRFRCSQIIEVYTRCFLLWPVWGISSDLFTVLSDLYLGDHKVTWKKLVDERTDFNSWYDIHMFP